MPHRRLENGLRRCSIALRAWLVALGVLSPWGIYSRLMTAFVAVAVLAAAANFLVEQGVSTVTAPGRIVLPPRIGPAALLIETPVPTERLEFSAHRLVFALERFDQAVRTAVESESPAVLARYQQVIKEVDQEAAGFVSRARSISGQSSGALLRSINTDKNAASNWIERSQARRTLLRNYSETLERMNARVNVSLDGAFRILGRVLARQSLLDLNGSLDAVRDSFSASIRAGGFSREAMQELTDAEAAFSRDLKTNAKNLRRAAGTDWFIAMETDARALVDLRISLDKLNPEIEATAATFTKQTQRTLTILRGKIETTPTSAAVVAHTPRMFSPTFLNELAPMTVERSQLIAEPPQIAQAARSGSSRIIVAWISIAVLAALLLISIATARSIVKPVRRLIEAARKIAAGGPATSVPRGGIKELDTLAVAFNEMAEQLATAQTIALESQHRLEAKVAERTSQLRDLAELDPLTNLPNRRQLFTLLNASIERAARERRYVGVFFLDVDNFKTINDSVGHTLGDRLLEGIARRLETAASSLGFAARLGGDEFTIVYESAANLEDIRAAGTRIMQAFQSPIDIEGKELSVSVSVGASAFPDHERDAEALLVAADAALFRAKALGRSRLSMFTPDLLAEASAKFEIEQGLRRALERDEFELFFQPEVSVTDLQTNLVEALIRWRMSDGTYVAPGKFLAVAEESGLIIQISDWVLRTAIRAAAEWHRGPWPQARIAINVSPRQLLDYRFVDRVRQLLEEFELPPRCIEIELTESVVQTGPAIIEQLHRLRAIGVAIALDDFGTGYSSLASLEQLPLNRVKLDRRLIESIDSNARSSAIVHSIIGLCHGLELEVTAEGIERAEQLEKFLGYSNLSVQGYLLARPVAGEQLHAAMIGASQRVHELVLLSEHGDSSQAEFDGAFTLSQRSATA